MGNPGSVFHGNIAAPAGKAVKPSFVQHGDEPGAGGDHAHGGEGAEHVLQHEGADAILTEGRKHIYAGYGRVPFPFLMRIKACKLTVCEKQAPFLFLGIYQLSLIHISEPTRLGMISYAVFCLKKKKKNYT